MQVGAALFALGPGYQLQAGAEGVGDGGRRCGGVDVGPGGLHQPLDDGGMRGHKGSAHACGLAQRAHVNQAFAAQAEVRKAAPALGAEHAEAVRIVHHQPGIEALSQRQQGGQVGQIAVHAEDRVGDDEFDGRIALL